MRPSDVTSFRLLNAIYFRCTRVIYSRPSGAIHFGLNESTLRSIKSPQAHYDVLWVHQIPSDPPFGPLDHLGAMRLPFGAPVCIDNFLFRCHSILPQFQTAPRSSYCMLQHFYFPALPDRLSSSLWYVYFRSCTTLSYK